ncbi:hypothetical protein RV10_GL002289 [Enterococcus pallens]|nr:hypothetical protein RV10_GL002289 [Enterococcus pallens]
MIHSFGNSYHNYFHQLLDRNKKVPFSRQNPFSGSLLQV